jgi:hypothetical protein
MISIRLYGFILSNMAKELELRLEPAQREFQYWGPFNLDLYLRNISGEPILFNTNFDPKSNTFVTVKPERVIDVFPPPETQTHINYAPTLSIPEDFVLLDPGKEKKFSITNFDRYVPTDFSTIIQGFPRPGVYLAQFHYDNKDSGKLFGLDAWVGQLHGEFRFERLEDGINDPRDIFQFPEDVEKVPKRKWEGQYADELKYLRENMALGNFEFPLRDAVNLMYQGVPAYIINPLVVEAYHKRGRNGDLEAARRYAAEGIEKIQADLHSGSRIERREKAKALDTLKGYLTK